MSDAEVLSKVDRALVRHFGHQPVRASVSFVGVDPIEVLRFEPAPTEVAYLSLGMSRRPMTGLAAARTDLGGRRAELMVCLRLASPHADVWRRLALLAAAPAVEGVVYTDGMAVDLGTPLGPGSNCTGVVIATSTLPDVRTPAGPVAVLRALPATATELAWSRVHGTTALRDRWSAAAVDVLDLGRRPVTFD